jgi:hypothetical protein
MCDPPASEWRVRYDTSVGTSTAYRACVALAKVNYGSAPGNKPVELTEAARLNCRAVRARLAEQQENADATT